MADIEAGDTTQAIEPTTLLADLPEFLTVPEIRRYLRVSRGLAYDLAQTFVIRFGRCLRIPKAALVEMAKVDR